MTSTLELEVVFCGSDNRTVGTFLPVNWARNRKPSPRFSVTAPDLLTHF